MAFEMVATKAAPFNYMFLNICYWETAMSAMGTTATDADY